MFRKEKWRIRYASFKNKTKYVSLLFDIKLTIQFIKNPDLEIDFDSNNKITEYYKKLGIFFFNNIF